MIDTQTPVDRAVLVSAPPKGLDSGLAEEHVLELARLTDTAGGEVVDVVTQPRDKPDPKFYIGSGKAEEVRVLVEECEADLVIFDEDLTPAQGKALEELIGVRIIDRSELILDIFATRARTSESKMQVELAQLEYLLPRLKRMWQHLSRIRGGIGLRGPGETQLETDRRLIGRRISQLKRKLKEVSKARAVQRSARTGAFRVAFVGYTNAGKSSLLRVLSGTELFVEDRLFATLESATRAVDLGRGYEALITDTVGFIRKLPHHLVASFRSTLEEAREADVLIHVIDGSHADWAEQKEVVEGVLAELDLAERPTILAFNKSDRLTHAEEDALRNRIRAFDPTPSLFISAHEPDSLDDLREALIARIRDRLSVVDVFLRSSDGALASSIYREGEVLSCSHEGDEMRLRARLSEASIGRLASKDGVRIARESGSGT